MSEYLSEFAQDSQEQITTLNNSLLTLERSPDDEEALRRIFRAAHTLKGNCGAMGLTEASDVAHAIEDLLEVVRAGKTEVTAALMDTIFDGVDELETMIEEAGTDGEIRTDPSETIEELRAQIETLEERSAIAPPTDEEIDAVLGRHSPPADDEHDAYFVRLEIDENDRVNNGLLVVEALRDAFELIGTDPRRSALEEREYDRVVDAVFASPVERAAIAAALEPVDAVTDFEIVNVTDRFEVVGDDTGAAEDDHPGEDVDDLSVDELLDEVSEFDDLDALVDEVEDVSAFDDMGDAGTFDELLGDEEFPGDDTPEQADAADEEHEDDADEPEQVDDASAVFAELKDEVEMVGFDELRDELEELEFDEFDTDEEVEIDELLGDDVDLEDDTFLEVGDELLGDVGDVDLEFDEDAFEDDDTDSTALVEVDPASGDELEEATATDTPGDESVEAADDNPVEAVDDGLDPSFTTEDESVDSTLEQGAFGEDDLALDASEFDEDAFEAVADSAFEDDDLALDAGEFEDTTFGAGEFDEDESFAEPAGVEDDSFAADQQFEDESFTEPIDATGGDDGFEELDDDADEFETTGEEFASSDGSDAADAGANDEFTLPSVDDLDGSDDGRSTDDADESIQSVRVDVDQIDSLLTLVEGLVTSRVRLRHAIETGADLKTIDRELDGLEDLTSELQETVMDVRLVPLETVINRLPRVVRDIAREQEKDVTFELTGEDVELDRSILDAIGDPLIHMVRNAVDHGIEPPADREAAGKSREGTVEMRADRSRDRVTIEIEDDGAGLDPDQLRREAVEADVLSTTEADDLTDEEAADLIFHPGLSTAEEVTDISGRGVGMDVVKRTIDDLDGTVTVESEPGEGTLITLTLPVTVAIEDVLFLESGGEEFGVPTKVIGDVETVTAVEVDERRDVLVTDDAEFSIVDLGEALDTSATDVDEEGMFVRVRGEVRPVAIRCDEIRGQQEVVVKPFEGFMSDIPGIGGATVRGRGEVVNILDVTSL